MQQPGRPRQFNSEETLSKIMQLFWEKGYEATGLSDIISATGLGKASLYSAFGNKQSMYLKALAHYENLIVAAAVSVLRSTDLPPLDRIDTFLSSTIVAVRDHNDRRGCFLCNASADRASLDEETGNLVRLGYEKMRLAIAHSLSEAFPNIAPSTINGRAQLVLTVYSGLRVMARSGMEAENLSLAKDEVLQAIGK
ncbi:MAG: TetR/AcrR family transcriptional regulator [Roseobacter sp.]